MTINAVKFRRRDRRRRYKYLHTVMGRGSASATTGRHQHTPPSSDLTTFRATGKASGKKQASIGGGGGVVDYVALDKRMQSVVGQAASLRAASKVLVPLFSNSGFVHFLRNLICSIVRLVRQVGPSAT